MVLKVFCDINVSHVTSKSLAEDENICFEFLPKFDDDKENWDPNDIKKYNSLSVASLESVSAKKKTQEVIGENDNKTDFEKENSKENKVKEVQRSIPEINKNKEKENDTKVVKKESKQETDIKKKENEKEKEVKKINSSSSFSNDTTQESAKENNKNSESNITLEKPKKEILGKRQRKPLEDITYLFVPEKRIISTKRIRTIEVEKNESPKIISKISSVKKDKTVLKNENKKSIKSYNIYSENSKENKQPLVKKAPLSNISNRSNININNNINIKNSQNSKLINIPKPCFINVKKNKPVKRNIIPKKSLKSKPNSYNISARMLR